MTPYNPAVFTPPSPTQYVTADITSPEWRWTAGTTWQVTSPTVFGTATPGTFKITNYSNGYYWGVGAAPLDSTVGNYTVLGSMTPEGNVLFSLLFGGTSLESLSGQITGDATTGNMVLRAYTLSGPTGAPTLADIMPVSTIAAGQTYFLSNVGSTVIPAFTGGTLQVDASGGLAPELPRRRLGHQSPRPARQLGGADGRAVRRRAGHAGQPHHRQQR